MPDTAGQSSGPASGQSDGALRGRYQALRHAYAAVDDVSLDIGRGEFFALLGPSGCGKTTLLRMLAGFETPDDGPHPARRRGHRRRAALSAAGQHDVPELCAVPASDGGGQCRVRAEAGELADKPRSQTRVAEMLALVKLEEFGHRKPHQLSGGQRQRVALARALAKSAEGVPARRAAGRARQEAARRDPVRADGLQQRLGLTFIIVTHDQEEAMTMADRIGVMHHGKLVQVGTPARNLRRRRHALGRGIHRRRESVRRHGVRTVKAHATRSRPQAGRLVVGTRATASKHGDERDASRSVRKRSRSRAQPCAECAEHAAGGV